MADFKDYYVVLGLFDRDAGFGLGPEATPKQILDAFKSERSKWHPDRFKPSGSPEWQHANERFKLIQEANDVLSNPAEKAEYDGQWHRWHAANKTKQDAPRRESQPPPPPPEPKPESETPHEEAKQTYEQRQSPQKVVQKSYFVFAGLGLVALIVVFGFISGYFGNDGRVTSNSIRAIENIHSYEATEDGGFEEINFVQPNKLFTKLLIDSDPILVENHVPGEKNYTDIVFSDGQRCVKHGLVGQEAQDNWECSPLLESDLERIETYSPSNLVAYIQGSPVTAGGEILESGYRQGQLNGFDCHLFWTKESVLENIPLNVDRPITITNELCLDLEAYLPIIFKSTSESIIDGQPRLRELVRRYTTINKPVEIKLPN